MKYYLLLDGQNIIRDAITYPVDGYVEVEVSEPLPAGINGGWYKWENNTYVEIPALKPVSENEMKQRIADLEAANVELQARLRDIELAFADLVAGGVS